MTSKVLGRIPAEPSVVPPWTVYVFPELVTPYVNNRAFCPFRTSRTSGRVVLVKNSDWWVEGAKMWEKVYREKGVGVKEVVDAMEEGRRWERGLEGWFGSVMRTEIGERGSR
jgi:hypothetical protein